MFGSLPFPVSMEVISGLTATNAMTCAGLKSTDNVLAVISFTDSTGLVVGQDVTDFTAADGTITAATVSLANMKALVVWTSAPAA